MEKPMVLAPFLDLESKENAPNQVKNQAVGQFLEVEVGKIDAEAVLESKENAPNQARDQTVANVQNKIMDPKFLDAVLESKENAPNQAKNGTVQADPQGSYWDEAEIVADTKANHKANIADPEVKNLEDPEAVGDQKSVGGQDEGREPDGQHQKSVGGQDEGH